MRLIIAVFIVIATTVQADWHYIEGTDAVDDLPWSECDNSHPARPAENLRILAVGDMVFSDNHILNEREFKNFSYLYQRNDLVLGNLEGVITTKEKSRKQYVPGKSYAFKFSLETADLLKNSGFRAVNLANNHALDYSEDGLAEMVTTLENSGITPFGHQKHSFETIQIKNKTIALVGFGFYGYQNAVQDLDAAAQLIRDARAQSDVVIVSMHGGAEGKTAVYFENGPEFFLGENRGDLREFSRVAIESGADAVIGHGPHVVRAVECISGKPIFYSLGNFVSAGGLKARGLTSIATAVELAFDESARFVAARLIPVMFNKNKYPQYDPTGRAVSLTNHLSRYQASRLSNFNSMYFSGFGEQGHETEAMNIQDLLDKFGLSAE